MDNRPVKVSVLCTTYNHEPYIRRCLEGFVSQETDFPFEVLVNDDASSDGTAAVVREFAERYPGIIRPFLQEKNLYSQGINIYDAVFYPVVRGEYIAACEGDDCWIDPHKLQRQADFLDAHPDYSACVHNSLGEHIGSREEPRPLFPQTGDRDVPFSLVLKGMGGAFHTSSILARREYLLDPPDFRAVAFSYGFTDYAVGLWLAIKGKIRFLDTCMSLYRIGSNPSAWSSGVNSQYPKLIRFVTGEAEMLRAVKPHVGEEEQRLAEREILKREYELLYLRGRTREMVKPPYDALFREEPFSRRAVTRLKNAFPRLHAWYRKKRGYGE